ncbi:Uncharacterised protein [uncultured archaeon]|nr:Uncharacterised protein [uncultured archaeon]
MLDAFKLIDVLAQPQTVNELTGVLLIRLSVSFAWMRQPIDVPGVKVLFDHRKLLWLDNPLIGKVEPYWVRLAQTLLSLVSNQALLRLYSSFQSALRFKVSLR